jgi:hypothetical protein
MASEHATYMTLLDLKPHEELRVDWAMAQFIDEQIDALAVGENHSVVNRRMYERGVSEANRRRVLAGQAVHRARAWRALV